MLAWLAVGAATVISADEDRGRKEAAEAERLCAAELPHWELSADSVVLDNPAAPVLRWTNPSAGRVYGNTYLWLSQGRPAAAGSLYRYFTPYRSLNGELVALAATKLVAKRNDKVIWRPRDEWRWHALPGAPAPAATAPQRLIQMRTLVGELTVEMLDTRNVPKGEDQSPRLLPRPIYRYDMERTKTQDGAVYAFVVGTDPELLLVLECDTAAAKPEWRYGVGRMNRDALRVLRKGEKVWEGAAFKAQGLEDTYRFLDGKILPKP
jgi:hypothetical protein